MFYWMAKQGVLDRAPIIGWKKQLHSCDRAPIIGLKKQLHSCDRATSGATLNINVSIYEEGDYVNKIRGVVATF